MKKYLYILLGISIGLFAGGYIGNPASDAGLALILVLWISEEYCIFREKRAGKSSNVIPLRK